MPERSPLAPAAFPDIPDIPGVSLSAVAAGIRYTGRTDLLLVGLNPESTVAGVFTRSLTAAAPVEWCRAQLARGSARGIIVNSGNANAFTGSAGTGHVRRMAAVGARVIGCEAEEVFVASTGVIGEPLPVERIEAAVPRLTNRISGNGWEEAARAIMTTDTFPKGAVRTARIGATPVTIAGIAKGSGMIAPDMATMLAFVVTDAAIPAPVLQTILERSNARTFNCTTVDSDTSTSDTLLLAATGRAGNAVPGAPGAPVLRSFRRALTAVLEDLATQVVRDGEGASKFITIDVTGAATHKAAQRVAMVIANSPLVKTAIAGEDANWGRIVMAVGKAGERIDADQLRVAMGGITIAAAGARVPDYDETKVTRHLKGSAIDIEVDLGVGRGKARVWTCDLTYDYIRINAEYRS